MEEVLFSLRLFKTKSLACSDMVYALWLFRLLPHRDIDLMFVFDGQLPSQIINLFDFF
jgi:hypothetical protein